MYTSKEAMLLLLVNLLIIHENPAYISILNKDKFSFMTEYTRVCVCKLQALINYY